MSIPDPADSLDARAAPSRLAVAMRVVALLGSVVSVSTLWLSERSRVRDDLQLVAEATARPGERLALRAFYLQDVEAAAGPSLSQTEVFVRLLDTHGRQVAETALHRARDEQTMEGTLLVPTAVRGSLLLEARAQLAPRAQLKVVRPVEIFPEAPLLAPRFREAPPLQQLSVGALHLLGGGELAGPEPVALSPRVLGGACVPEEPCQLLVWMGGAGAQLTLQHDAALSAEPVEPSGETPGFVSLSVTVHGPEAVLTLGAQRQGQRLAERTVRLPVALGSARLDVKRPLLAPGDSATLSVALPPGRSHGILDTFIEGRWSITRAFQAPQASRIELGAGSLAPGLVRLQAHTDKFGGEGAGSRLLYVRRASETAADALHQLLARARGEGLSDALTDGWLEQLPPTVLRDEQRAAAFVLAAFELQRTPLPRATSGRPRELQRLSRTQTGLRFGVGAVLTLSALVVGLTLMRRGLSAQREAEAILNEGERETGIERNRAEGSSVAFVVSLVLVVCLAFLAAALLIVAKPLWF